MFLSSVYDKFCAAEKKYCPSFGDFCTSMQIEFITSLFLKDFDGADFVSKIENSERKIPAINFEYAEIPSDIILIKGVDKDVVSHRDVLGSVMNLGIKRSKIGDIIVGDKVYLEVKNEITPYILSNLSKIRNRNVEPLIFEGELSRTYEFKEMNLTVSSLRADCIVSGLANLSRENAKELILSGRVSVNSKVFDSPSKCFAQGDVISIRGNGKYLFSEECGTTKKERLKIIIKKYI